MPTKRSTPLKNHWKLENILYFVVNAGSEGIGSCDSESDTGKETALRLNWSSWWRENPFFGCSFGPTQLNPCCTVSDWNRSTDGCMYNSNEDSTVPHDKLGMRVGGCRVVPPRSARALASASRAPQLVPPRVAVTRGLGIDALIRAARNWRCH